MAPDTLLEATKPAGWIRIGELADRAEVTRATIHHYVKLGLLSEPVKTNERMAYYDPACVDQIGLIRELREQRFLPLSAIKRLVDSGRAATLVGVDDAILGRLTEGRRYSRAELLDRCPVGAEVFDALVKSRVLSPEDDGSFSSDDAEVLSRIQAMGEAGLGREAGFDPALLAAHVHAVEQLIDEEFAIFNERLLGEADPDEVARLAGVAIEHASGMLAALHRRRLLARLAAMTETDDR